MTHNSGLQSLTQMFQNFEGLEFSISFKEGWGDYFEYFFPISSKKSVENWILNINFSASHIDQKHINDVVKSCFASFNDKNSDPEPDQHYQESLIQSIHNIISVSDNGDFQQECLKLMGVCLKDYISKNMRVMFSQKY